jgi:lipoate-protein ligase B
MHGLSLNVCPDMRYFENIVPCGIVDKSVTSMHQLSALKQTEDILAESWAIELGESLPVQKIDIDEVANVLLKTLSIQVKAHLYD